MIALTPSKFKFSYEWGIVFKKRIFGTIEFKNGRWRIDYKDDKGNDYKISLTAKEYLKRLKHSKQIEHLINLAEVVRSFSVEKAKSVEKKQSDPKEMFLRGEFELKITPHNLNLLNSFLPDHLEVVWHEGAYWLRLRK